MLIDEVSGLACSLALSNGFAVTATLTIDYQTALPTNSTNVVKVEGRKVFVEGIIETLAGKENQQPKIIVRAKGIYLAGIQGANTASKPHSKVRGVTVTGVST
ncbi:thioesterase [Penicillium herquei]|nr:thioesterase [Penicillium herquei]